MHKWAKQIMECVKAKVDGIGIDNFEGKNLDDLKDFTEIAKNIACFDKDYRIVEAMEKSEDNEDIMRMLEQYEDYPDRRYYDHYRYANGRFAPKGHGTYRKGYEETPYRHMTPEDYHSWENKPEAERRRDLDRMQGRMFFSEPVSEGKYEHARRNYTETKHTKNEEESNMRGLEMLLNVVDEDIKEFMPSMSQAERAMTKSKLSTWAQRL